MFEDLIQLPWLLLLCLQDTTIPPSHRRINKDAATTPTPPPPALMSKCMTAGVSATATIPPTCRRVNNDVAATLSPPIPSTCCQQCHSQHADVSIMTRGSNLFLLVYLSFSTMFLQLCTERLVQTGCRTGLDCGLCTGLVLISHGPVI
jgi:hypothetical protein